MTGIANWSPTAALNVVTGGTSGSGGVNIDEGMARSDVNNAMRDMLARIATQLGKVNYKGSDIASASTVDLSTATGNFVHITGTTTITALGTVAAGQVFVLVFDGALTFTHNGTSLILPAAANITTAAGDIAIMVSEGSGNWRCLSFYHISTQANLETGTSLSGIVTPGRAHYHASAAKSYLNMNGSGTAAIRASYNITSITDNGVGDFSVTIGNDHTNGNYTIQITGENSDVSSTNDSVHGLKDSSVPAAGSYIMVETIAGSTGAGDPVYMYGITFGPIA